jgi:hypothetical protein
MVAEYFRLLALMGTLVLALFGGAATLAGAVIMQMP